MINPRHRRLLLVLGLLLGLGASLVCFDVYGRRERRSVGTADQGRPAARSGEAIMAVSPAPPLSTPAPVCMSVRQVARNDHSAVPVASVEQLSLADALDARGSSRLAPRLQALLRQGGELSRPDWERLRDFVRDTNQVDGLNADQFRYLMNEAMSALVRADGWSGESADVLSQVHHDEKQDLAVRDYALQFLAVLAERDASMGWEAHWKALLGRNEGFAATASLHLLYAVQRGELVPDDRRRLEEAALKMAADGAVKAVYRATALQVCAELGLVRVRGIAYTLSRDENAELITRLSAISALGRLGGDREMQNTLRSLSSGRDQSVKAAAAAALAQFKLNQG